MTTSLLFAVLLGAAQAEERVLDRLAAVVNDDVITLSEVYENGQAFIEGSCNRPGSGAACRQQAERQVLDELVRVKLQEQALEELGIAVTTADVEAAIQDVVVQYDFADREALRAEIERSGLDWEGYRRQIRTPLVQQRFAAEILRSRITIRDDEVQAEYRRLTRDAQPVEVRTLSAIGFVLPQDGGADALAAAVQEIRGAVEDVRAGRATWDELAEAFDTAGFQDTFEARTWTREDLVDKLAKVAFDTEVDTIPEPVIANGVLTLIQVKGTEQRDPEVASLDDSRAEIENAIFQRKVDAAEDEWFELARRRAAIRWYVGDKESTLDDVFTEIDEEG